MFIKNIKPFNSDEKELPFYKIVDLVKSHYELELQETDLIYSKIKTDDYRHLGNFISDVYLAFTTDITDNCIKYDYNIKELLLWNYYIKESKDFKERTNKLFDKYYPPTS